MFARRWSHHELVGAALIESSQGSSIGAKPHVCGGCGGRVGGRPIRSWRRGEKKGGGEGGFGL